MTKSNVLILGAGGQVTGHVVEAVSQNPSIHLTLYLRDASRVDHFKGDNVRVVEADIMDTKKLSEVMPGQHLVYVNINGQEDVLTEHIVDAMKLAGVKRLIFIAAIGVYHEVAGAFGEWNERMIGPYLVRYRKAVSLIESSGLEYTILRPTWYTDKNEVDYVLTQKGEPITRTEISRRSVADLIVKVIEDPALYVNESLGMEKPGSEGSKPSWH